eukprot:6189326-Pleurochrysis_carterae.AAC.2
MPEVVCEAVRNERPSARQVLEPHLKNSADVTCCCQLYLPKRTFQRKRGCASENAGEEIQERWSIFWAVGAPAQGNWRPQRAVEIDGAVWPTGLSRLSTRTKSRQTERK